MCTYGGVKMTATRSPTNSCATAVARNLSQWLVWVVEQFPPYHVFHRMLDEELRDGAPYRYCYWFAPHCHVHRDRPHPVGQAMPPRPESADEQLSRLMLELTQWVMSNRHLHLDESCGYVDVGDSVNGLLGDLWHGKLCHWLSPSGGRRARHISQWLVWVVTEFPPFTISLSCPTV